MIYVLLLLPSLPITKETIQRIVHVMGIIRVNAFSVVKDGETVATGLYTPSNLINHACDGNCRPETSGVS